MSRYFYIKSQLNRLVLTIDAFTKGGNLVMYPAYGGANQLWKWGPNETLVSKMGLVADNTESIAGARCCGYMPYSYGAANQKWKYVNGVIQSTTNDLVMNITEGNTAVSATVQISQAENENLGQIWILVPENEIEDIETPTSHLN